MFLYIYLISQLFFFSVYRSWDISQWNSAKHRPQSVPQALFENVASLRRGEFWYHIISSFCFITKQSMPHFSVSRVTLERWLSTCMTQPTIGQENVWQWRLWNKKTDMCLMAGWKKSRSWSPFITPTLSSTKVVVVNWVSAQLASVCFKCMYIDMYINIHCLHLERSVCSVFMSCPAQWMIQGIDFWFRLFLCK